MGPRFRKQAGEMFTRVVRDYPASPQVKMATERLKDMEMPVPAPSQAALDRAKYEQENYVKPSMTQRAMNLIKSSPDLSHAAHIGAPTMTDPKKTLPASIPVVAPSAPTETSVTANPDGTAAAAVPTKTDITADTTTGTTNAPAKAEAAACLCPPIAIKNWHK